MKKKRIVIGVIIAAAAAGAIIWAVRHFAGASGEAVYVQSVADLNYATNGGYQNRFSGVVEPQQTQEVKFVAGSTLEELYVAEGDEVSVGDKLFAYDTAALKLAIQQADLELEQLRTKITTSKSQIADLQKEEKTAKGADKASLSAQIQALQVEVSQAEYDTKTKEAEKTRLGKDMSEAVVKAEIDGTIDSIAELTDAEDGGSSVLDPTESGSDVYITILAKGNYRVKGTVSEQNYAELYETMPVLVRSRVDENVTWKGTISSIGSQPAEENKNNMYYEDESSESASKYNFYVALEETGDLLMGQHVTVEADLSTGELKTGIWIDEGYLVFEGEENGGEDSVAADEVSGMPEDGSGDMDGNGMIDDGAADDGMTDDGMVDDGTVDGGMADDGLTGDGMTDDGMTGDGMYDDGTMDDGLTDSGLTDDGLTDDGMTDTGIYGDGTAVDGMTEDGMVDGEGMSDGAPEQVIVSGTAYVWATSEPGGRLEKRQVTLGEYDPILCAYQILDGLAETDYIAWPDSNCRVGARTTTELPTDDGEMDGSIMPGGEMGEFDGSVMPGGEMGLDGETGDGMMYDEEGVVSYDDAETGDGMVDEGLDDGTAGDGTTDSDMAADDDLTDDTAFEWQSRGEE